MKSPAFTYDDVTVSPAQQIGRHASSNWELSYVLVGSGVRTIGDSTECFDRGEVILIPPDIPHEWKFGTEDTDEAGNISNICVFFAPALLDGLRDMLPELRAAIERLQGLDGAVSFAGAALERIRSLLLAMRGRTAEARLPLMLELLVVLAYADGTRCVGRNTALRKVEQRLEKVRVYCACNYAREITLADVAAHVGMNKSAFCTFMRRNAGVSLSEFVNGIRLEHARDRIVNTDDSIAGIAFDSGFSNVTYFNRLFRARYGCTPMSLRNK